MQREGEECGECFPRSISGGILSLMNNLIVSHPFFTYGEATQINRLLRDGSEV